MQEKEEVKLIPGNSIDTAIPFKNVETGAHATWEINDRIQSIDRAACISCPFGRSKATRNQDGRSTFIVRVIVFFFGFHPSRVAMHAETTQHPCNKPDLTPAACGTNLLAKRFRDECTNTVMACHAVASSCPARDIRSFCSIDLNARGVFFIEQ